MTNPDLFSTILGAVLLANLLTAGAVWGAVKYSQLEKNSAEKTRLGNAPLAAMVAAVGFLGLSLIIVYG